MNAKPQLTDVKTLRVRARRHIEEGAVTEGYRGDRTEVLKLLNEALATELAARGAAVTPASISSQPLPFVTSWIATCTAVSHISRPG